VKGALDGGALDVENARLEPDEDAGLHEPEPTSRRYTSW
jgi:hypothetical protein